MKTFQEKIKGFTLLEVMLVLAIASSLFVLLMNYSSQKADELRRDKVVLQMQQILNAGMSFYLNKSYWPLASATVAAPGCGTSTWTQVSLSQLAPNYIPTSLANNAYGNKYYINCNSSGNFYVASNINNSVNASIIAGRLPLAYTAATTATSSTPPVAGCQTSTCTTVVSNVNIPGQNLNNARSVNFGAIYYSGSCVPAPNCPPNMKPSIFVMPASVSGLNTRYTYSCTATTPPVCSGNVSSLTSFTAFARGYNAAGDPGDPNGSGGTLAPLQCLSAWNQPCMRTSSGGTRLNSDGTKYWRVCLAVNTDQGFSTPYNYSNGRMMGSVVAITRCVPNNGNESPSGSVDVWDY